MTVLPCDAVQLLAAVGWWVAWWWADEHRVSVDLDLALLADGTIEVVDEDEF